MLNKEKLDKIHQYVKNKEDFFYKHIEEGKYELGSMAYMQCMFQATAYQDVGYFIESLIEDGEEN